jgi:dolichyl-phosphate beta-glucosyltransferase
VVAPKATDRMKLSIVIPAYNEARRLPATLASITEYLDLAEFAAEVIVVDDGSTDGTAEAAKSVPGKAMPPKIIGFEGNRGKGAAVKEGMLAATGDYVLFMDADNSTHITEVEKLLKIAVKDKTPVVIGSRYQDAESIKIKQPWYRVWISRMGNRLIRHTVLPGVLDTQCGFKLFSKKAAKEIAPQLTMTGFSFDMELLVIAKQLGLEIREVPVNWYDTPGKTRVRPLKSSLATLRDLIKIRWNVYRGRYAADAKSA